MYTYLWHILLLYICFTSTYKSPITCFFCVSTNKTTQSTREFMSYIYYMLHMHRQFLQISWIEWKAAGGGCTMTLLPDKQASENTQSLTLTQESATLQLYITIFIVMSTNTFFNNNTNINIYWKAVLWYIIVCRILIFGILVNLEKFL